METSWFKAKTIIFSPEWIEKIPIISRLKHSIITALVHEPKLKSRNKIALYY